jgi:hypothetical protein
MKYHFDFLLRSDDYFPVSRRLGDEISAVREILNLDRSAVFRAIDGDFGEEGTESLCSFRTVIVSDNPASWLESARRYASLRELDVTETRAEEVL